MATFDQLSDEQRAIVELVLQQGKSYEELSEMLGISETRVRERARDALVELAPVSARGVEEDWRGQLADYVLGQQAGPEATATRGHLRRSEAARSWTRSLLDSLEQLYPADGDLPAIPDAERAGRRGAAPSAPAAEAQPSRPLGPSAVAAVRRRRILAAVGAALVLALVLLVWPVGLLTGDDGDDGGSAGQAGAAPIATEREGAAVIARERGKNQILVTAQGLKPSTETSAYQVWLYSSKSKRKSLGATVTDNQGRLQVVGELPEDFRDYEFIDVTTVAISGQGENQNFKDGPSVLRGELTLLEEPVKTGTGEQQATVLANVRLIPLPSSGG